MPLISIPCYDFFKSINEEEIINNIIEYLSKGYYIQLILDEYFVPQRHSYKKYERSHENLIYGYDKTKKEFSLLGYENHPVRSVIGFKEFLLSCQISKIDTSKRLIMLKYIDQFPEYNFNLKLTVKFLEEYINGENSNQRSEFVTKEVDPSMVFGVQIIDHIIQNDHEYTRFLKDIRISYIFCEHKRVMVERIKLMHKRGILSDDSYDFYIPRFIEILNHYEIIANKVLYYQNKNQMLSDNKIKNMLKTAQQKEIDVISQLIMFLSKI